MDHYYNDDHRGRCLFPISLSVVVNIFSSVDHPSKLYKNTMEVWRSLLVLRHYRRS